jgi:hypothetical protein
MMLLYHSTSLPGQSGAKYGALVVEHTTLGMDRSREKIIIVRADRRSMSWFPTNMLTTIMPGRCRNIRKLHILHQTDGSSSLGRLSKSSPRIKWRWACLVELRADFQCRSYRDTRLTTCCCGTVNKRIKRLSDLLAFLTAVKIRPSNHHDGMSGPFLQR